MTITELAAMSTTLNSTVLLKAFNEVKVRVALPPVVLKFSVSGAVSCNIVGVPITIDGEDYVIKEVVTVLSESIGDTPSYDNSGSYEVSFLPGQPSGSVYFANNYLDCEDAEFNLICYLYPSIIDDVLPAHLVLPTLMRAMAIVAEGRLDITLASSYDTLCTTLINFYNMYSMFPQSAGTTGMLEVVPNEL